MSRERKSQKSIVLATMQLFNVVLVVLQLWLFIGVLENIIGGHYEMAVPGAVASVVILTANLWILRGVYKLDAGA